MSSEIKQLTLIFAQCPQSPRRFMSFKISTNLQFSFNIFYRKTTQFSNYFLFLVFKFFNQNSEKKMVHINSNPNIKLNGNNFSNELLFLELNEVKETKGK